MSTANLIYIQGQTRPLPGPTVIKSMVILFHIQYDIFILISTPLPLNAFPSVLLFTDSCAYNHVEIWGCWVEMYGEMGKMSKWATFFYKHWHKSKSVSWNQRMSFIHWNTFQHTSLYVVFLHMAYVIPKPNWHKKAKKKYRNTYTSTMQLRHNRRSNHKDDAIRFPIRGDVIIISIYRGHA